MYPDKKDELEIGGFDPKYSESLEHRCLTDRCRCRQRGFRELDVGREAAGRGA